MSKIIPILGEQIENQCNFLKTEIGRFIKLIENYVDAVEDDPHPTNKISIDLLIKAGKNLCELSDIIKQLKEINGGQN